MKAVLLLAMAFVVSGCTTYSISNQSLLDQPHEFKEYSGGALESKPLQVKADKHCYEGGRSGRIVRIICSNKNRIDSVVSHFKERGYSVYPAKDGSGATIAIEEKRSGWQVNFPTSLLNMLTLGLFPYYSYADYVVTYTDPDKGIEVSRKMRISEGKSWFHMFMSNPDNIEGRNWENDAEQNLIRLVLDEANVELVANPNVSEAN